MNTEFKKMGVDPGSKAGKQDGKSGSKAGGQKQQLSPPRSTKPPGSSRRTNSNNKSSKNLKKWALNYRN